MAWATIPEKDAGVVHCEVGEDFAVQLDVHEFETFHEPRVGETFVAGSGVDPGDPQFAEDTFLDLAVAVVVLLCFADGVLRVAVVGGTESTVAFRHRDNAFAALAAGWAIGCSRHFVLFGRWAVVFYFPTGRLTLL